MIRIKQKGDWRKTKKYLEAVDRLEVSGILDKYGQKGVELLKNATPVDTGLLASSWSYEITKESGNSVITWNNSDVEGGCNVAILIQYGHGTKSGTYVKGVDFINPATRPLMDELADEIWKEVTKDA